MPGVPFYSQPFYLNKEAAKKPDAYTLISQQAAELGSKIGQLEANISKYKEKGYVNLLSQAESQLGKIKPQYEKVSGKKKYYDDLKAAETEKKEAIQKAQAEVKAAQQQLVADYQAIAGAPAKKSSESIKAAQAALKEQIAKIQKESPQGKYSQLQKELGEAKKGVGSAVKSAQQEYQTSLAQLKAKYAADQAAANKPSGSTTSSFSTADISSFLEKAQSASAVPKAADIEQDKKDALAEAKLAYQKAVAEAKTKATQTTKEKKAAAQKLVQEKVAAVQAAAKEAKAPKAKQESAAAQAKAKQEYQAKVAEAKKTQATEAKEAAPKAAEAKKAGETKVSEAKKAAAAKAAAASKLAAEKIAATKAAAKKKK